MVGTKFEKDRGIEQSDLRIIGKRWLASSRKRRLSSCSRATESFRLCSIAAASSLLCFILLMLIILVCDFAAQVFEKLFVIFPHAVERFGDHR